jgi:hypothetical protein
VSRHAWNLATGAALALALALWRTGFHVVPAAGGDFRGLSDLPRPVWLVVSLLAAAVLALALSRRPLAEVRPFLWLALAGVPLVPVMTGALVLGLLFQGPVLVLLATAVSSVALARRFDASRWREPSPKALLLAALAFYAALGTRLPGPAGPQGDEPHYLAIAQSLLSDGDLDLKDEIEGREYALFYAGTLRPHTSPASPPGRALSIHTPGLPVLILPAYWLGGYPGVRLFLSLLAAAATLLVFLLVRDTLGSVSVAWAAWAVITFAPPLPFFAVALYPETPAVLATAVFLFLARRSPTSAGVAVGCLTACCLPWIHPKLLPFAVVGLVLTLVPSRSPRLWFPALLAFLGSLALLLLFFHATYGRASLSAAYGTGFSSDVALDRIPRGALALLLDRQFGLLSVAPVWALALPGLGLLWRARRADTLRCVLLSGATLGVGASFSMWWGGSCPPARFVVPCLPALALLLAPALRRRRDLAAGLLGLSVAIVAWAAEAPRTIHNHADGESGLLRLLSADLDLDSLFPSFVVEDPSAVLLALSLLAVIALAWQLGGRGFLLGAASYLVLVGGLRDRGWIDTRLATLRLLEAWDGDNLVGVSGPLELPALSIPIDLRSVPWLLEPGHAQVSRRLDLPPGRYQVLPEGSVSGLEAGRTAARLHVSAQSVSLEERRLLAGPSSAWAFELLLPVGGRQLRFEARGLQGRLRLDGVRLVPEALARRRDREALSWTRSLSEASYRLGSGVIRTTALDGGVPEGDGFRLEGDGGRFVVDVPRGREVLLHVERPEPSLTDALEWGPRRIDLRGAPTRVSWRLDPGVGIDLGTHWLVPLRVRSRGAWVALTPQ